MTHLSITIVQEIAQLDSIEVEEVFVNKLISYCVTEIKM